MTIPEVAYGDRPMSTLMHGDFLKSYLFSQGDPSLQVTLFEAAALLYQHNLTPEQQEELITLKPEDYSEATVEVLPAGHLPLLRTGITDDENVQTSLSAMQTKFQNITYLTLRRAAGTNGAQQIGETIAGKMIAADLMRQAPNRARGVGSDLHGSYFREFVLLGPATRSLTYKGIFDITRQSWERLLQRDATDSTAATLAKYDQLTSAWERNHAGAQFTDGVEPSLLQHLL